MDLGLQICICLGLCIYLLCNEFVIGMVDKSGLCATLIPSNITSVSCAHQLWGTNVLGMDLNKPSCSMLLPPNAPLKNSTGCDAVKFDHDTGTASNTFGIVSLKSYYYAKGNWKQTVFNVTYSNITWTNMFMRFQEIGDRLVNFCRHFIISSSIHIPAENTLFYDCLWSHQDYESVAYSFEYTAHNGIDEAHTAAGKFLFFVPNGTEIDTTNRYINKLRLFVYMDLSEWPVLKLRLQLPQGHFINISLDHITVILHHHKTTLSHKSSTKLDLMRANTNELMFAYDTKYDGGEYYFTAQIEHEDCKLYSEGCLTSRTPIYAAPDDFHLRLMIGIVGCGGALLSIFVFVYFIRRWSLQYKNGDLPTVLIIYAPTTEAHIRCAVEFAKFLQNACSVNALLDVLEIPKTKTQDPFTWCNEAFLRSDLVMVLTSPYHQCNSHEGIYRNVDVLGLRTLKEKLGDHKSKQKFFTVILPYCSEKDIPSEVKNLKRFVLMKDLNKMLTFIHSCRFKGNYNLDDDGWALLEALSKVEAELDVSQKCICSNAEKLSLEELDTFDLTPSKDSSEDMLLPPRDKSTLDTLNMYPGPLDDLNLLGDDGIQVATNVKIRSRTTKEMAIDLNDLDLG